VGEDEAPLADRLEGVARGRQLVRGGDLHEEVHHRRAGDSKRRRVSGWERGTTPLPADASHCLPPRAQEWRTRFSTGKRTSGVATGRKDAGP
jgi:hypothetical protein